MARSTSIPIGIMAYQSRSLPWASQRLINWYAETAPPEANSKTRVLILPRPGLDLQSTIAGGCRGQILMGDLLYGVYGSFFLRLNSDGSITSLGIGITGNGQVSLAASADQITIVSNPDAWVYTASESDFVKITDPDFLGSAYVTFIAGYFVHVVPGESGEFFYSNLFEAREFDALDFATAEMDGDALLTAISDHGELWLFGTQTIEPWGPTGNADQPFQPIASAKIQRGLAARFSVASQDNSLFWLGDDLVVYRANGYVPLRVSTHAIEKALTESAERIGEVVACSYTQDGHSFYQITLRNSWTFVFDNATGLWHERQTFQTEHWKVNSMVQAYGKIIAGHDEANAYALSFDNFTDDGDTIRRLTMFPVSHADTAKVTMSRLQVDFQVGVGLNDGQGDDPQAMLSFSKDGGRTYGNEHWRSMGAIGEYLRRVIWRRLGQFYSLIVKIEVTDPIFPVILGAYADLEVTPS